MIRSLCMWKLASYCNNAFPCKNKLKFNLILKNRNIHVSDDSSCIDTPAGLITVWAANYQQMEEIVTLTCNAILRSTIWAVNRHDFISEPDKQTQPASIHRPKTWGPVYELDPQVTFCFTYDSYEVCQNKWMFHWIFQFCGWTVHREGPCFLADSHQRFQWPLCVSQWHGTVAWHACKGTSSPLTSYSWFLIFSGLHKIQLSDKAEGIIRQGWITRHTHTHTQNHSQQLLCSIFLQNALKVQLSLSISLITWSF